ncbi:hypothetical protein A2U94_19230 [Bacillus sp. VT 712]|jgi:hypothetical protein|uniref:hypothetical protein n=1 Tax=Bacillaceae TaxID=186817 RepID=UPI0007A49066|nr:MULTISPECIES: hypothetical protein [Bacillaceae]KZB89869.1 hypothetical protein A2U94_19230 [Bacillus sp. VT 712]QCS52398.1 hypothetical protein FED53_07035 [Priestia flexa]
MKKYLVAPMIGTLLLTACGGETEKTVSEVKEEAPKQSDQKSVNNEKDSPEENEDGNTIFTVPGQKADVEIGTLELLKIKNVNEFVDILPIKVEIESIKLFKLTNASEDFIENVEWMAEDTVDETAYYIQILYNGTNLEEKNIDWMDLNKVVLSNGQQIDVTSKNFMSNDADSHYYGKVQQDYGAAFIVKDSNINKVKLIFHGVNDADTYETIAEPQQVEYTLE